MTFVVIGMAMASIWQISFHDGEGLIAHLGAKLAASNTTSGGEATEMTRMRPERGGMDWKRRRYGENYRRHGSQLDSLVN